MANLAALRATRRRFFRIAKNLKGGGRITSPAVRGLNAPDTSIFKPSHGMIFLLSFLDCSPLSPSYPERSTQFRQVCRLKYVYS